jgi:hypothetical protein
MPDLLHEFWEDGDGFTFSVVSDAHDNFRAKINPNGRFLYEVWAPSWEQAMERHYEREEYGPYKRIEDLEEHFYTEEEAAEQQAYLRVRGETFRRQ